MLQKPRARMHGQQGSPLARPVLLPMSFCTVLRAIKSLPQVHQPLRMPQYPLLLPGSQLDRACRHRSSKCSKCTRRLAIIVDLHGD